METIFDHNITSNEMIDCFGCVFPHDLYISKCTENDAKLDLAYLYHFRGEIKIAQKYINSVSNAVMRNEFWRTVTHK